MFEVDSIVPEKCRTCPSMIERQLHIDDHEIEVDSRIQAIISDRVDSFAEHIVEVVHDSLGFAPETLSPETIARDLREAGSEKIASANRRIADIKNSMAAHALGCFGLVVLTREHNRRVYEVGICVSPKAADTQIESAVVKRKRT